MYAYGNANPLSFVDPSGHISQASYGESNGNVVNIQRVLRSYDYWTDYTSPYDGVFGEVTKSSVIRYQEYFMNLTDDDLYKSDGSYAGVGPRTAESLTYLEGLMNSYAYDEDSTSLWQHFYELYKYDEVKDLNNRGTYEDNVPEMPYIPEPTPANSITKRYSEELYNVNYWKEIKDAYLKYGIPITEADGSTEYVIVGEDSQELQDALDHQIETTGQIYEEASDKAWILLVITSLGKFFIKGTGKAVELPSTSFTTSKLQHEFKHAGDFGVTGNWNNTNKAAFENAVRNQMNSVNNPIIGTYRGNMEVYHFYDAKTGLNTMIDKSGNFVGGWKLSADQIANLLRSGNIQ